MIEELKERYLLFKASKGSGEAIGEIFDRYFQKIYRFVYFRVGTREEAEDIASDVFLQFQSHLHKGGEVKNISGLLYQIARNKLIDFYRARKPDYVPLEQLEGGEKISSKVACLLTPDANDKLELQAETQAALKAMDKLKPEYREVLLLHYISELSVKETGAALAKTENNIRVMLFRALGSLREILTASNMSENPRIDFSARGGQSPKSASNDKISSMSSIPTLILPPQTGGGEEGVSATNPRIDPRESASINNDQQATNKNFKESRTA